MSNADVAMEVDEKEKARLDQIHEKLEQGKVRAVHADILGVICSLSSAACHVHGCSSTSSTIS